MIQLPQADVAMTLSNLKSEISNLVCVTMLDPLL